MRRGGVLVSIMMAALAVLPASPAAGDAELEPFALSLGSSGAVSTVLRSSAAVTRFDVAIPHRWSKTKFETSLRWNASDMVAAGSAISVDIDDVPVAAVPIKAGPGALTFSSPILTVSRPKITVAIRATLQAVPGVLPRAAARGLFVRLDLGSWVQVSGAAEGEPLLSDLPGALVERVGDRITPLTIALPAAPSVHAIHAAAIIAGAVAASTGFPGVRIATLMGGSDDALASRAGALIRIVDRPGETAVSIRRRARGESALTIEGRGETLVRAAWTLAYHAGGLSGSSAVLPGDAIIVPPSLPPFDDTIALGPSGVEDSESLSLRLPFRIPVGRVVDAASLVLELAHDRVPGARLSVRVNGGVVESRVLDGARTRVAVPLEDAVHPGDNSIEILFAPPQGSDAYASARLDVLTGSALTLRTRDRVRPALDWWPFLGSRNADWSGTVVSLPAGPTEAEVDALISTLAEAVRWSGGPLRYRMAFDASIQETLRHHDLVALVRDPYAVARFAPGGARDGTLAMTTDGAHAALLAVGPRALTPLAAKYFAGSVTGASVVVDARGSARSVVAAAREPIPGRRWWLPVGLGTGIVMALLLAGFVRAKRRFAQRDGDAPWTPRVPEAVVPRRRPEQPRHEASAIDVDAALEEWLRIREEHRL